MTDNTNNKIRLKEETVLKIIKLAFDWSCRRNDSWCLSMALVSWKFYSIIKSFNNQVPLLLFKTSKHQSKKTLKDYAGHVGNNKYLIIPEKITSFKSNYYINELKTNPNAIQPYLFFIDNAKLITIDLIHTTDNNFLQWFNNNNNNNKVGKSITSLDVSINADKSIIKPLDSLKLYTLCPNIQQLSFYHPSNSIRYYYTKQDDKIMIDNPQVSPFKILVSLIPLIDSYQRSLTCISFKNLAFLDIMDDRDCLFQSLGKLPQLGSFKLHLNQTRNHASMEEADILFKSVYNLIKLKASTLKSLSINFGIYETLPSECSYQQEAREMVKYIFTDTEHCQINRLAINMEITDIPCTLIRRLSKLKIRPYITRIDEIEEGIELEEEIEKQKRELVPNLDRYLELLSSISKNVNYLSIGAPEILENLIESDSPAPLPNLLSYGPVFKLSQQTVLAIKQCQKFKVVEFKVDEIDQEMENEIKSNISIWNRESCIIKLK
ncbi:hypothetical protein DFA_11748 [Cavenderia fasciculata]|uniref:F-box domain-containing protein n=1 Tax=Cavenderia fasciculata TaxID=261658 RepID=F4QE40_CACFS|nr:uncharacterized protein DFA_11748 [Cavenderia fasciculata]EGG13987.1 hypothetical protein DFA_11748 [Cavenderia fasciculata]|eukprot:XP_004350695.1 hypothetical protein DFA_11748 [Cavenderia fasciculata]